MTNANTAAKGGRPRPATHSNAGDLLSLEHYLRLIVHRKWLVLGVFVLVSVATVLFTRSLPNVYTSETVVLVDPQKVPESYVKSTVTGDVRDRLGTLSQQILSATRLQKIIDGLSLYPEERKKMAREDVLARMRADISVNILSDFGGRQDLQAFRIIYSGRDPRLVAQVANQLANLFIDENMKDRALQATGTTDFLQNQLQETRKALEEQEGKLRDFRLKHLGEMPEQQSADLQILGQLQMQLQAEADALSRAQQQKNYLQSMLATQPARVVDLDDSQPAPKMAGPGNASPAVSTLAAQKARLEQLRAHYKDNHPDVRKLKKEIELEESREALEKKAQPVESAGGPVSPAPAANKIQAPPPSHFNPILQSQLEAIDAEVAKHKAEQERLSGLVATYQAKLQAIPVREQQIAELVRDYEISKTHYSQLLNNQLSAETATQLEIRQKGETFRVLDPAMPAERPSRPNRSVLNAGGSLAGLVLGVLLALATELLGMSITAPGQITAASGFPVLEVIPVIRTWSDRRARRKRIVWAAVSGVAAVLACCAVLLYHYRTQFF